MNVREISVINVPEIPGLFDDCRQNNVFNGNGLNHGVEERLCEMQLKCRRFIQIRARHIRSAVGEALTRCVSSMIEKNIAENLGLAAIALTALTIIALQLRQLIA